jgi:quercetin dioxygenase-like cupin family protein
MNKLVTILIVLFLSSVTLADDASKEVGKRAIMISFNDLKWTESLERKGTQFAPITGDPKTAPYTQMRKLQAGTDNPLHTHSSEITNVVISGILYTGADMASAKDFGPGSVLILPANWPHVSGCRAGKDCIFYQEGKGKFDYKAVAGAASNQKRSN